MQGRQGRGKYGNCRKIVAGGWARGGGDNVCQVQLPTRWCCLHPSLHFLPWVLVATRQRRVSLHPLRRGLAALDVLY